MRLFDLEFQVGNRVPSSMLFERGRNLVRVPGTLNRAASVAVVDRWEKLRDFARICGNLSPHCPLLGSAHNLRTSTHWCGFLFVAQCDCWKPILSGIHGTSQTSSLTSPPMGRKRTKKEGPWCDKTRTQKTQSGELKQYEEMLNRRPSSDEYKHGFPLPKYHTHKP